MELPTSAPLTDWVRRLVDDEPALHSALETPVVVWEGDLAEHAPSPENPVVFLVKKVPGRPNPFGAGVTMGRAEHNDLVFPHASVSRFHAYFTPDPTQISRWNVIDAASRNGTLVDGVPIPPNSPATLGGATRITVGEMALTFLSPAAFLRWLTKVVDAV
jgi:pSer/pThr/pTyr-binding forkhead associated (FHA) protein